MSAKRFVAEFVGLFLVLFFAYSYIALEKKNLYMSVEYPMWQQIKEVMGGSVASHYSVLVIGDSRAKSGFSPKLDARGNEAFNLSLGGSTPIEGYYTFKNYIENNKAPDKLVISYSPGHLTRHGAFWTRNVRFDFLSWSEYEEIIGHAIKYDSKIAKSGENFYEYSLVPSKYIVEIFNGIRQERWEKNQEVWNSVWEDKGHVFFGKAERSPYPNAEAKIGEFNFSPLLEFYLAKLMDLAADHGVRVYWYTMPFNHTSYELLSQKYRDDFTRYLTSVSKKSNVIVLKDIHYLDDTCFGDSSHIYRCATQVTEEIFNFLDDG